MAWQAWRTHTQSHIMLESYGGRIKWAIKTFSKAYERSGKEKIHHVADQRILHKFTEINTHNYNKNKIVTYFTHAT